MLVAMLSQLQAWAVQVTLPDGRRDVSGQAGR